MKKKKQFNFKMFLTNRKDMAMTIVMATVAIGLTLFAIIPQFQTFLSLNTELQNEKPRLDKLKQKLVELENIQFTPEFAQAEIVEDALPSKKPLLELLTSLNTIAVANFIRIDSFDLNPGLIASNAAELQKEAAKSLSKDGVDSLEISMTVSSSFENIQNFLIDLEKISPFTTINTLSLNSVNRGDDFTEQEKNMQANITTRSYFFTQAISASIEAPLPTLSEKEQDVLRELSEFSKSELPEQLEIMQGGVEDLFGVDPIEFNN